MVKSVPFGNVGLPVGVSCFQFAPSQVQVSLTQLFPLGRTPAVKRTTRSSAASYSILVVPERRNGGLTAGNLSVQSVPFQVQVSVSWQQPVPLPGFPPNSTTSPRPAS